MEIPDQVFKYFIYIKDVIVYYPKFFLRILDELEHILIDENDPSGLHELPEHTKDIVFISKIGFEYMSNDNRSDHEKFINRYKKLIGCKPKGKALTEDKSKNKAVRIIAYLQILYIYIRMDAKDIYQSLTEKQTKDRKMCGRRVDMLLSTMFSLKKDEMTEEDKLNKDILMAYFVSYSGNKFTEVTKFHYPMCYKVKEHRLGKTVSYLAHGLMKPGMLGFKHYAQLGWMFNQVPRSAEAYDKCIRYYYFAACAAREVTFKDGKTPKTCYFRDFWFDIEKIGKKVIKPKDLDRLQLVYLELAKMVYLPFLYGYGWTVVMRTETYKKIMYDLDRVANGIIPTHSDISDVVEAVSFLANTFTNPEISNSVYLQCRIDDFVKVSQAKSDAMKERKWRILNELSSFKKKKQRIENDKDMSEYLRVFMNEITGSYRISELIHSDKFELKTQGDSVVVENMKSLLSMVPMVGSVLTEVANQVDQKMKDRVKNAIKANAANTVESFYNREIEQITEYVGITYLYENELKVKEKFENEHQEKEEKKEDYQPFNWVEAKLEEAKSSLKADLEVYNSHKFLSDQYKEPAEAIAYRDAWYIIDAIGNSEFIVENGSKRSTLLRHQKIEKMRELLSHYSSHTDEEIQQIEGRSATQAGLCGINGLSLQSCKFF